jgi:hypothetical protein
MTRFGEALVVVALACWLAPHVVSIKSEAVGFGLFVGSGSALALGLVFIVIGLVKG